MKTTLLAAIAASVTLATAQEPYYNVTSAPFHLVVESATNSSINCSTLFACHEGAGIEGLCLGNKNLTGADVFHFNTSSFQEPTNSSLGDTGILSWDLETTGATYGSALTLQANPSSNVGMPLFFPGDENAQSLAFDANNRLNIQGYLDDSVSPVNLSSATTTAYYRWYICDTYFGYAYTTLAWTYGSCEPQNPSCQKVDVKRVWA